MNEVKYINEDSVRKAAEIEGKFVALTPEAGVIFVSVRAMPTLGGASKTFDVRLGLTKKLEEATGNAMIRHVLRDEISAGLNINATTIRGVPGAAR